MKGSRGNCEESETVMLYKVPLALLSSYANEDVIVRSSDPAALVKAVLENDSGRIKAVQLLSPGSGMEALGDLPRSMAIDLCLMESQQDSGMVPVWRKVLKGRAVRLVVPVVTGFSQAVKEALRAGMRVGLDIDQPGGAAVAELKDGFVFFTREPDVKEPVDLFYGLFRSFLTKRVESLWQIQEEHPSSYRYVTDSGEATLSRRLTDGMHDSNPETLLVDHKLNLFVRKEECCTCRFFNYCEGYFKLPKEGYSCSAVKEFLGLVWDVAAELRLDLAQLPGPARAHP
jgi:hypothetical protein